MRLLAAVATGLLCGCAGRDDLPRRVADGDRDRGQAIINRVGCAACHRIPGIDWPVGTVGGSLEGFARRPMIAGRFPNRPDVLVAWLQDAPSLSPVTGMPPMPITPAEARDVAAYLYALDDR